MFEKIIVKLDTPEPNAELISLLRKITGLGIAEIKNRIINGEPVAEYVLFSNDQPEVERSLVSLITQTSSKNRLKLYDIGENESWEDNEDISKKEITSDMLLNYFKERKLEIERYYESFNE